MSPSARLQARTALLLAVVAAGAVAWRAEAAPVVLYDGALGTPPDRQGWTWLTDPLIGPRARYTTGADAVTLDSSPLIAESAGWFANIPPFPRHPDLPVLDRDAGHRIEWDLQVLAETHSAPERAGFSVIVLGDDLLGVELSFWADEIWAQSDAPLFTHGEGVAFDTTRARTRYALDIRGSGYRLTADGVAILTGPLKDYSSFGAPYDIPDFVFLGDDTSRGSSRAELARVAACAGDAAVSPGGTLRVSRQGSDLRLDVAATGATEWRAYRDASAQAAGSTLLAVSPAPTIIDATSIPAGGTWYFIVRAVDGCGREHD